MPVETGYWIFFKKTINSFGYQLVIFTFDRQMECLIPVGVYW
jgi:hypothetical protein